MVEIKDIATASIDPESTVNVRKSQVEEGVEKLKSSIKEKGFWEHCPIVIRPHPDGSSKYEYEIVMGQCRLKACLALGQEQIPAVIKELDDDAAIQESWVENEASSDLTIGDKVFWANFFYQKYRKQGRNKGESRRGAGDFLGVGPQRIIKWLPLDALPDDVMKMVSDKKLGIDNAAAIVETCGDVIGDEFDQKVRERAEWIMPLDKRHKEAAVKVLKEVGSQASIKDLDEKLADIVKNIKFEVTIAEAMRPRLIKWGDDAGLIGENESTIGSNMIATELSRK